MVTIATEGTATNPQVCTAPTLNGHGESKVNEPNEEEKGNEEASTLSSLGVSVVQGPQLVAPKQPILLPARSYNHQIQAGQALHYEDFNGQLFDMDPLGMYDEEDLYGFDGEFYEGGLAMAKHPQTIGVMQNACGSDESQQ